MEYTNYETNEPISRDQFIARGVERGELLFKYECGCVIIQDRTANAYIVYCYKHEAAPELYEALKTHTLWTIEGEYFGGISLSVINKALAKAEGRK